MVEGVLRYYVTALCFVVTLYQDLLVPVQQVLTFLAQHKYLALIIGQCLHQRPQQFDTVFGRDLSCRVRRIAFQAIGITIHRVYQSHRVATKVVHGSVVGEGI